MKKVLPEDAQLEKEYRHNGTTADLWINWNGLVFSNEVFLELKVRLTRKSECDRLIGQIEGLDPKKNNIVVVIIDESDERLVERVKNSYSSYLDDMYESMAVLTVDVKSSD